MVDFKKFLENACLGEALDFGGDNMRLWFTSCTPNNIEILKKGISAGNPVLDREGRPILKGRKALSGISKLNPLYLSKNVEYSYNYAKTYQKNHLEEDFVIVLEADPSFGMKLFDLTEPGDFEKIFSDGKGALSYEIFRNAEPFVSFNSNPISHIERFRPVEYTLSRLAIVYRNIGVVRKAFPDVTEAEVMDSVRETSAKARTGVPLSVAKDLFDRYGRPESFLFSEEFRDVAFDEPPVSAGDLMRMAGVAGVGAKKLGTEPDWDRLARGVNSYLQLFEKLHEKARLPGSEAIPETFRKMRAVEKGNGVDLGDGKLTVFSKYVDVLQYMLFDMVPKDGSFCGMFAPEFVGAGKVRKFASLDDTAIVWDASPLKAVKAFPMHEIAELVSAAREAHAGLHYTDADIERFLADAPSARLERLRAEQVAAKDRKNHAETEETRKKWQTRHGEIKSEIAAVDSELDDAEIAFKEKRMLDYFRNASIDIEQRLKDLKREKKRFDMRKSEYETGR